jgi:hypothetical protein
MQEARTPPTQHPQGRNDKHYHLGVSPIDRRLANIIDLAKSILDDSPTIERMYMLSLTLKCLLRFVDSRIEKKLK